LHFDDHGDAIICIEQFENVAGPGLQLPIADRKGFENPVYRFHLPENIFPDGDMPAASFFRIKSVFDVPGPDSARERIPPMTIGAVGCLTCQGFRNLPGTI
jgi:hypothetical protein